MTQDRSQESAPTAGEASVTEPPPDPVAELFRAALPGLKMTVEQTALDVAITVRREDLAQVMQTALEDERLAFDFLRCLSGVDHLDELEVVYHLYSYKLGHAASIKVRCPIDDPHMPTVSHLWQAANWHEREAAEMFGLKFDGHPDLRPLLTEEGLGYYVLRKTHPLAEIEEWQEDYLKAAEEAATQEAAETGAPIVDEKARKIQMAQQKAAIIKKAREDARAKGLSGDDEKAAVKAALKAFEEEEAGKTESTPSEAPPKPANDRAAKIVLAQKKAAAIKKAREEARARGASPEEERQAVAEALKAVAAAEKGGQ